MWGISVQIQKRRQTNKKREWKNAKEQIRTTEKQVPQILRRAEGGYPSVFRKEESVPERDSEGRDVGERGGRGDNCIKCKREGETTLLHSADLAYLLRKQTGERILINVQPFLIGKEDRRVSYCIRDNTSVSRCHAKITRDGMHYYIEDQESTNGTYVEENLLRPYQKTVLKDHMKIRLSDEVFEFHIV